VPKSISEEIPLLSAKYPHWTNPLPPRADVFYLLWTAPLPGWLEWPSPGSLSQRSATHISECPSDSSLQKPSALARIKPGTSVSKSDYVSSTS